MIIGIIGLGLMGGSLALALKKSRDVTIVGYDHHQPNQIQALELGLVDKIVEFDELKRSDIIILAIPVDGIVDMLGKLADINKDQTIIDLGSTKVKIIQNTPNQIRSNLVAAHPMAGTEKSGPTAAIDNLYKDRVVVLCDVQDSGELHLKRTEEIFGDLGMDIVYMDSLNHDKDAAYISHLPHVISFSLANCVLNQEDPKSILALAGGGFKDMSRIAKSSPNMWVDVFRQNRENLIGSIEDFQKELSNIKQIVQDERYDELYDYITDANKLHKII